MAWSEKAIEHAIRALLGDLQENPDELLIDQETPSWTLYKTGMRAALDAAAAVDGDLVDIRTVTAYESGFEAGKDEAGDAQWNAAIDEAAKVAERDKNNPTAGRFIAANIRSLKRLK